MKDDQKPKDYELRYIEMEVRADGDEGERTLVGHAARFNRWSVDLGGFREKIAPGAFSSTIADDDVVGLFNHNPSQVIGRTSADTLELKETSRGLQATYHLPDTQLGRDLFTSVQRGDIIGQSFGFVTMADEWKHDEKGNKPSERTLTEVRLLDVSPVTYPAYPDTDVATRAYKSTSTGGEKVEFLSTEEQRDVDLEIETLKVDGGLG